MTTQKAAMEQARDALLEARALLHDGRRQDKAASALIAALAETAEPVQEPFGWLPKWAHDRLTGALGAKADLITWGLHAPIHAKQTSDTVPLYTAPQPPAPAEADLEAARQDALLYGTGFVVDGKRVAPERVWMTKNPAPAVELTDEEIGNALAAEFPLDAEPDGSWQLLPYELKIARAAIAAHEAKK